MGEAELDRGEVGDGLVRPTRELLERALARDVEAERALFERYRPALLREATANPIARRFAPLAGPDDVVQEVWRRALAARLLARFEDRGRGSLERTLRRVLEFTLSDWARRASAEKRGGQVERYSLELELPERERTAPLQASATTPTSAARATELLELCRAELDAREWSAWRAVELEGKSAVEAAAELGTSAAAVRGLLFRARSKLVERLCADRGGESSN